LKLVGLADASFALLRRAVGRVRLEAAGSEKRQWCCKTHHLFLGTKLWVLVTIAVKVAVTIEVTIVAAEAQAHITIAEAVMFAPSAMLKPLLAPPFMARLADANTDARHADLHALRH